MSSSRLPGACHLFWGLRERQIKKHKIHDILHMYSIYIYIYINTYISTYLWWHICIEQRRAKQTPAPMDLKRYSVHFPCHFLTPLWPLWKAECHRSHRRFHTPLLSVTNVKPRLLVIGGQLLGVKSSQDFVSWGGSWTWPRNSWCFSYQFIFEKSSRKRRTFNWNSRVSQSGRLLTCFLVGGLEHQFYFPIYIHILGC